VQDAGERDRLTSRPAAANQLIGAGVGSKQNFLLIECAKIII
jgi:hypothetical protein